MAQLADNFCIINPLNQGPLILQFTTQLNAVCTKCVLS